MENLEGKPSIAERIAAKHAYDLNALKAELNRLKRQAVLMGEALRVCASEAGDMVAVAANAAKIEQGHVAEAIRHTVTRDLASKIERLIAAEGYGGRVKIPGLRLAEKIAVVSVEDIISGAAQ